ncbi:MAG: hypothetical protein ABSD03_03225 [Vulcanimicrobiaceae bacterium]
MVRTILALERSCLDAESALVERRWRDVDVAFAAQRRLTEELAALFVATPESAPLADAKVAQRLRGVLAYREDQMRRLRAYHQNVGERLRSIGKVRQFARAIGKRLPISHVLNAKY